MTERQGPRITLHRCPVKLYRCCGEGIVQCERLRDHDGLHVAGGVDDYVEWP